MPACRGAGVAKSAIVWMRLTLDRNRGTEFPVLQHLLQLQRSRHVNTQAGNMGSDKSKTSSSYRATSFNLIEYFSLVAS